MKEKRRYFFWMNDVRQAATEIVNNEMIYT